MSIDPAHDSVLLALVDRQKFFERMLLQVPDTPRWGPLRFTYFVSIERLQREVHARMTGG